MNSAHNCPNRETQEKGESETGLCQVPWEFCYAAKTEKIYDGVKGYRDQQEFLWDNLDPVTFAKAFIRVVGFIPRLKPQVFSLIFISQNLSNLSDM